MALKSEGEVITCNKSKCKVMFILQEPQCPQLLSAHRNFGTLFFKSQDFIIFNLISSNLGVEEELADCASLLLGTRSCSGNMLASEEPLTVHVRPDP